MDPNQAFKDKNHVPTESSTVLVEIIFKNGRDITFRCPECEDEFTLNFQPGESFYPSNVIGCGFCGSGKLEYSIEED